LLSLFDQTQRYFKGQIRDVEAEAVKFLWKWKHFEERSWKQTRKHLTFEEPEAEAFSKTWNRDVEAEAVNFSWKRNHFKERSWKQT